MARDRSGGHGVRPGARGSGARGAVDADPAAVRRGVGLAGHPVRAREADHQRSAVQPRGGGARPGHPAGPELRAPARLAGLGRPAGSQPAAQAPRRGLHRRRDEAAAAPRPGDPGRAGRRDGARGPARRPGRAGAGAVPAVRRQRGDGRTGDRPGAGARLDPADHLPDRRRRGRRPGQERPVRLDHRHRPGAGAQRGRGRLLDARRCRGARRDRRGGGRRAGRSAPDRRRGGHPQLRADAVSPAHTARVDGADACAARGARPGPGRTAALDPAPQHRRARPDRPGGRGDRRAPDRRGRAGVRLLSGRQPRPRAVRGPGPHRAGPGPQPASRLRQRPPLLHRRGPGPSPARTAGGHAAGPAAGAAAGRTARGGAVAAADDDPRAAHPAGHLVTRPVRPAATR
ncbi:hypothetical protein SGPA1_10074 [Streptomyces misionensis JCM 4497]